MANLSGLKVAILIENGFEQVEMTEPRKALDQAGADTSIVSPRSQYVRGWNFRDWGEEFPVDVNLDRADPDGFRDADAGHWADSGRNSINGGSLHVSADDRVAYHADLGNC